MLFQPDNKVNERKVDSSDVVDTILQTRTTVLGAFVAFTNAGNPGVGFFGGRFCLGHVACFRPCKLGCDENRKNLNNEGDAFDPE